MNESLDQQAGHKPAPSTGSGQVGPSCGSTIEHEPQARAQGTAQPGKAFGRDALPLHGGTLTPQVANLNGVAGNCGAPWRRCAAIQRRLCALGVVMKS